jgi:hypothetical protein
MEHVLDPKIFVKVQIRPFESSMTARPMVEINTHRMHCIWLY